MGNALTEMDDITKNMQFEDVLSQTKIAGEKGTEKRKKYSLIDLMIAQKKSFMGGNTI